MLDCSVWFAIFGCHRKQRYLHIMNINILLWVNLGDARATTLVVNHRFGRWVAGTSLHFSTLPWYSHGRKKPRAIELMYLISVFDFMQTRKSNVVFSKISNPRNIVSYKKTLQEWLTKIKYVQICDLLWYMQKVQLMYPARRNNVM